MSDYFIYIKRDSTNIYGYDGEDFAGITLNGYVDIPNIVFTQLDSNVFKIDFDSKLFDSGRYQVFSQGSRIGGMEADFTIKYMAFISEIVETIENNDKNEKNIYVILGFLPDPWFNNINIFKCMDLLFEHYVNVCHCNIKKHFFLYKYYLVMGIFSYFSSFSRESYYYIDNDMIVDSIAGKKINNNTRGFSPWNSKEDMNNSKFIDTLSSNGIELHDELINNIISFTNFLSKEDKEEIEIHLCDERIKVSCKSIIEEKNRCYDIALGKLHEIIKTMDNKCNLCIDFTDELIIEKFKKLDIDDSRVVNNLIDIEMILKYALIVGENNNRANTARALKERRLNDLVRLNYIYDLNKFYLLTNRNKNEEIIKKLGLKK